MKHYSPKNELSPSEYKRLKRLALHLDMTVGALAVRVLRDHLAECDVRAS